MISINSNTIFNKYILSFERCEDIYNQIISEINVKDNEEMEYWQDFILNCIEYTKIRSKWLISNSSARIEQDAYRNIVHSRLIVKLKIIKRLIEQKNTTVTV
ncbi:hypothetical protein [Staphylococcus caeli]|uniref:Uncharacterized protein n=1 Tax=Staphylococcus caeli TaxID=2201815 RepID=A0A1D4KJY7_9STAP|nr:hypothetical protein [Staphylococcus caeli]SCS74103.1 Uncharacterised protein [Staphylococcus caeli]SCS74808.1 Uncharacterised protein [Staphylococcus caeli]